MGFLKIHWWNVPMRWGDVRICGTNALRRCHTAASPCTWLINNPAWWTIVERSHDLKAKLAMPWPSNCNEATTTCWALNQTLILVECSSWWTIHNALPLWWQLGALNYRYAWNMWQEPCLSLILAKPMRASITTWPAPVLVLDTHLFETIGCAAGPCLQPLCGHRPAAPIRLGLENNVKWTNKY